MHVIRQAVSVEQSKPFRYSGSVSAKHNLAAVYVMEVRLS